MIEVMFDLMRYFGLNHRPSSGVKWKLQELRSYLLNIVCSTEYKIYRLFIRVSGLNLMSRRCEAEWPEAHTERRERVLPERSRPREVRGAFPLAV